MTLVVNYKAVCDACGATFKDETYELRSARFVLPEPNIRRNQIADVLACDACVAVATSELVKIRHKEKNT